MTISAIVAMDEKHGIGKKGKIPWHIPEDLKRFQRLTRGHVVLMGRKTYESIGRPLPNRTNIVVTRRKSYEAPGCIVVHSLTHALKIARAHETLQQARSKREIFIIGGGEIYKGALPQTGRLYLTVINGDFSADTFFPDHTRFPTVISKKRGRSKGYSYTFLTLEQ